MEKFHFNVFELDESFYIKKILKFLNGINQTIIYYIYFLKFFKILCYKK